VKRYLRELIAEGEGLRLDFKYCISDSRKIARTLSAFANSEGGTLLIGVRDNGGIAGVRSDEEIYMIETAARLFCKPEIPFTVTQHIVDAKTILEVKVDRGTRKPYKAKGDDGIWRPYTRQNDQNIIANNVQIDLWRRENSSKGVLIKFSEPENALMDYLRQNEHITLSGFKRVAGINNNKARQILVNMIMCGVVKMKITDKGAFYSLAEEKAEADRAS
jgi:predicted HTH transcriptional regulator